MPQKNNINEIINILSSVETIIELFNYGEPFFHVKRIHNVPWLFFNEYQLIMLNEKQAKDIIKMYNKKGE